MHWITQFEILRHKNAGYVLAIRLSGLVIEPEVIAPSFNEGDWGKNTPEDGDIIQDRSYDALKRELTLA